MAFGALLAAVALSATRPEIVTAEFANAAEAERAQIAVAPLPDGKKAAFTSRWDDSSHAHVERSEMFRRVGMQPMFFLNGGKPFAKDALPKIKANGGRFGNHTVNHPFLMESGVNLMFREVMLEKIFVETSADMPNTSFAIPYGWSCPLEPGRAAKLAKILVNAGLFVSSDWPLAETQQPASAWMPGHTFNANDSAPDEKRYREGLQKATEAVGKNPDYPKITFGIHSWCKPDGLLMQEQWLKKTIADHPEFWVTDDAHYGAYRYEFWHAKTKKLGVKGNVATFEVQRHDPAYLGEVQPLTYTFGDVKPVKVEVSGEPCKASALPEVIDAMKDGEAEKDKRFRLTLKVDETKGELSYKFEGKAKVIQVVVNPAPMWSEGRILANESAKTVKLGKKNTLADYQEGEHLYVVAADFTVEDGGVGRRRRLYATETVKGAKGKVGGTPRDTMLVMGPMAPRDLDDQKWSALSVPGATLPNLGEGIHQFWRSMADKNRCGFSGAAYIPWEASVSAEFKDAVGKAEPKNKPVFLAAVDFVCDADGEKDLLVNRAPWERTAFWLNGKRVEAKGGKHRIAVRKGLNRIIYQWEWFQPWVPQACLLSVCDDRDVNRAVKFVAPKTEKRDCVFASDGFSVEFDTKGDFRTVEYAGERAFIGFGYESSKSLPTKKDYVPKAACKLSADKIVCTRTAPLGTKSDDFAEKVTYTVTRDKIAFEGEITVKEGVTWKGFNAQSSIQAPIAFYAGRKLRLADAKGAAHEIDYPAEFDSTTCRIKQPFASLDNGEWKIDLDGTRHVDFIDRRQWNNDSSCLQLCPQDGLQWGGKVSDGKTFVWRWTISRTAR